MNGFDNRMAAAALTGERPESDHSTISQPGRELTVLRQPPEPPGATLVSCRARPHRQRALSQRRPSDLSYL